MTNASDGATFRHLNPQKKDPQRIKRDDKQYIEKLDYTKLRNRTALEPMYKNEQPYPIHISEETFEDQMNHKGRKETRHPNKRLR